MNTTRLVFVHALSPLHPGTGQGTGVIDLPVAREKATGLPYLPGSSLKGSLRARCTDDKQRQAVFGPETNDADKQAGAVLVSDLRLLLLPVRSIAGVFAWVTSPYVLRRFLRDARDAGVPNAPDQKVMPSFATEADLKLAYVCGSTKVVDNTTVLLEDLDLVKRNDADSFAGWLGTTLFPDDAEMQTMLKEHLCIVHDDVLSFLLETATEITARIRLDESAKTVAKGALWYEEALPAETILAGMVVAAPNAKTKIGETRMDAAGVFKVVEDCTTGAIQLGGKSTVGRGLCHVWLAKGA